ncbi:MAG: ATP-binding protein [Frankia sp.]
MSVPRVEEFVLAPNPAEVRRVRDAVRRLCRDVGVDDETRETAVLLASETATNAVLHGRSDFHVVISVTAKALRVEIADDNSRHPQAASPDDRALDGRGVAILQMLATAWGVRDNDTGKTVWFELATS